MDPAHASVSCRTVLVLGGARSGKSRFAQELAEGSGRRRVIVATATAGDDEMAARIARHRSDREGRGWSVVEEPLRLADAICAHAAPDAVVLVDCLTLWLANLMLDESPPIGAEHALAQAVVGAAGPVVLVSNEVGLGLVPETPLGRDFRDRQGRLNQAMAGICDAAVFLAAGLPLPLKPAGRLPVLG
ncbi:bifunctional adenosylcobinamide kinase/adenosylcobinamide-phosphate guanylyltransferase [Alsobacter sp. R-9]